MSYLIRQLLRIVYHVIYKAPVTIIGLTYIAQRIDCNNEQVVLWGNFSTAHIFEHSGQREKARIDMFSVSSYLCVIGR